jgi:hypothetical protein
MAQLILSYTSNNFSSNIYYNRNKLINIEFAAGNAWMELINQKKIERTV